MVSAFPPDVRLTSVLLDQLLLPPLPHHPLDHHPFEDQHCLQDPIQVNFHDCIELCASWPVQYFIQFQNDHSLKKSILKLGVLVLVWDEWDIFCYKTS